MWGYTLSNEKKAAEKGIPVTERYALKLGSIELSSSTVLSTLPDTRTEGKAVLGSNCVWATRNVWGFSPLIACSVCSRLEVSEVGVELIPPESWIIIGFDLIIGCLTLLSPSLLINNQDL